MQRSVTYVYFCARTPRVTEARWQSGYAAACKAVDAGSIPTLASIFFSVFPDLSWSSEINGTRRISRADGTAEIRLFLLFIPKGARAFGLLYNSPSPDFEHESCMSLFEELKRRNVFRVGMAYAVSAWVVLQIVDLVLDNSEAPDWVMDVFMLAVILGFIVSLIIAWAYEVTPEGIKRESEVDRDSSITHQTGKKLNYITIGAVGVLIALFAADSFFSEQVPSQPDTAATTLDAPSVDETAVVETDLQLGIAVLPFTNLSEDPGNAFFAGGVHEDVLTHLSRIAELRVISRTSMLKISEREMDIREIGEYLGVSHVLEGSVRRAGDEVRVTVQLIDAATDVHLWAENFDRKLDDIFAIQSEIAQSIAAQLEAELSPEQAQRMAEAPTLNRRAYDLFQQSREVGRVWLEAEGFKQQLPLLEEAVDLDPDFLDALVDLVAVYGRLVWTGADPEGIYRIKAKQLADHIVAKWGDRPEADRALAEYFYTVDRDYERALDHFLKALTHFPGDSELLLSVSSCYKRLDRSDLGMPIIERALSLDPQHAVIVQELGLHLIGQGKFEEALAHSRDMVRQFPEDISAWSSLAEYSLSLAGDTDSYFEGIAYIRDANLDGVFWDISDYRMDLSSIDLDQLLAQRDKLRDEEFSWTNVSIDREAAELLNLAGRKDESITRATRSHAAIEALLSDGAHLRSNTPKVEYAQFAYTACLAGNRAAFNQYRSVFRALEAKEMQTSNQADRVMSFALAECGDVNAGWELLDLGEDVNPVLDKTTEWQAVIDPIYSHYFSELPQFQALVEKKNAEKT